MNKIVKSVCILSIIIVPLSLILFVLGATACFQRLIDLVATVILLLIGIPSINYVILLVFVVVKSWIPKNIFLKILMIIGVLAISSAFVFTFLKYTNPYGWIIDKVTSDYKQITVDKKYEYRLELINLFQNNSYARLYMKDISNGEEMHFRLDLPTREIHAITKGERYEAEYWEPEFYYTPWAELTPTNDKDIYILTVHDNLLDEVYVYEIDTSVRQRDGSVVLPLVLLPS